MLQLNAGRRFWNLVRDLKWSLIAPVLLLAGLLPLLLVEGQVEDAAYNAADTAASLRTAVSAQRTAADIGRSLTDMQGYVLGLATSTELQDAVATSSDSRLSAVLGAFASRREDIARIWAADRTGSVLGSYSPVLAKSECAYDTAGLTADRARSLLADLASVNGVLVSQPFRDGYGPQFAMGARLGPSGAIVVVEYSLEVALRGVMGSGGFWIAPFLIDSRGRLLAADNAIPTCSMTDLSKLREVGAALKGESAGSLMLQTPGSYDRWSAATVPIPGLGWHVVAWGSAGPDAGAVWQVAQQGRRLEVGSIVAVLLAVVFLSLRAGIAWRRERQRRINLSRFLSPRIAEAVASAGSEALPRRAELSVMFADVRGFTSWSEALEPEDLRAAATTLREEMAQAVLTHGGTLDKYTGDGILAFFGDPEEQLDHPLRAVRCALELKARLDALARRWNAEGRASLAVGIGINTGWLYVGVLGASDFAEYSVLGDSVNLASRLANLAEGGEILISERTHAQIGDDGSVFVRREKLTVKGKTKPVVVYGLS